MFQKVDSDLKFVSREKQTEKFWKENKIFEKSCKVNDGKESYTFYDGPPTANGKPHIGHVLTRAIKDLFPRYYTMRGYDVPRKAGWDTHGLPVELEVEKMLNLDGKEQIEKYGLLPFIEKCRESVWKYKGMWEDFSDTVGFWADMDNPYITYDNNFIESEWWALKEIWNKGLLYKGFKIVPYCPRCGTPLSSHEVAQGYKDVKERSAIVRFKAKGEDAYFLAWTTTPWTLPSNVALCVNPKEEYVKVKSGDYVYYMAKALCDTVLGEGYEIIESYLGKDLEYKEYEPLWSFVSPKEKCWYITCDGYVTLTDGTGIVHIAPAFGEDDANVGRKYELPFVQLVDQKGEMTKETSWAGMFCKNADKEILIDLDKSGKLFSAPVYEHSYPHCWRCGTPLIYYARDSWFIKMTAVKEDLIKNNKTVNWVPESIGTGRFGDWLENVQDWGISRNRYWGTPLNIWECSCGHRHSIGSVEELRSMSSNCPETVELHRPYIDEITIKCEKCGGEMHRVPEVIDCWFDSGAMPFAQHHYPFENKEVFERQFPANFISEAVDQTRGWFYSLLAISTILFNKSPYKNVVVLGLVCDENGQKMSKSKGNAVDPFEALAKYGADTIRWYFYTNSAPWLPSRFIDRAVLEGQRKFLGTLWNTYAFFVLYAGIDNFDPMKYSLSDCRLTIMDKWLLSRLNTAVNDVKENMDKYRIPESAAVLEKFVDEMSNWYVRRSRERFWGTDLTEDKIAAYMTLWTALVTVSKAAAPMIPFMTESIYQNLVRSVDKDAPESIHLTAYPEADESRIDKNLEASMDIVLKAVFLGRAARNAVAIKNRQPLSVIYLQSAKDISEEYLTIIADELNIHKAELTNDASSFVSYSFKPQLKTLGPKYGKQLNDIRQKLSELDGKEAKRSLDEKGFITMTLSIGDIELHTEDLLIETKQMEGYVSETDGTVTVALDTELTAELINEGFVNEVVSKLQTMRKETGFNVTDRITVWISGSEKVINAVSANKESVSKIVLADEIIIGDAANADSVKEWDINGETAVLSVKKN